MEIKNFSWLALAMSSIISASQNKCIIISEKSLNSETHRIETVKRLLPISREIKCLSLENNSLTSADFDNFTQLFSPLTETFSQLELLDLSHNNLASNCALSLSLWLLLPKLSHVNITGNFEIALKEIASLHLELEKIPQCKEALPSCMEKIIFMSEGYVKEADSQVVIYKKLKAEGIIPHDWVRFHLEFYKSPLIKRLKEEREENNYRKIAHLFGENPPPRFLLEAFSPRTQYEQEDSVAEGPGPETSGQMNEAKN